MESEREAGSGRVPAQRAGEAGSVTIAIPPRIDVLQSKDMKSARKWRRESRAAFTKAFTAGLRVNGFYIDEQNERGYYILSR